MTNRRGVALSMLMAGVLGFAGAARAETGLRERAEHCASAMLTPSAEAVECMHPRLVAALGGGEATRKVLQQQTAAIERDGAAIEGASVGTPRDPVEIEGRRFALVPQTIRVRVPAGVVRQEAFLLAIRESGEERWTFVDASAATPAALSQLFPDTTAATFEAQLEIPASGKPVLER